MPAILLTILLIPVFWALIVRPQQKRQREHAALVDSLVAGDRVEAFSGIHGTIVEVGDGTVRLEVAPGVVVTMARLAVASRLDGAPRRDGQDQDGAQVSGTTTPADVASAPTDGDRS